ncbi:MAG TPA: hypothetical protein VIG24_14120 [Acidimicrobiia bacterium]
MEEYHPRQEWRQHLYEREIQILAKAEPDPELEAWVSRFSAEPLDLE